MGQILKLTVEKENRVTLDSTKTLGFNADGIEGLLDDSTGKSTFHYYETLDRRDKPVEYTVTETFTTVSEAIDLANGATIDAEFEAKFNAPKPLDSAQSLGSGKVKIDLAKVTKVWTDPDDATKCFVGVRSGAFKIFVYHLSDLDIDNLVSIGGGAAATSESLSTSGAIDPTLRLTTLDSSGGVLAMTLADGTSVGQKKTIILGTAGNNAVVTPANFTDGTTITLDTADEEVELVWDGSGWKLTYNDGGVVA